MPRSPLAVFLPSLRGGGAERVVVTLVNHLAGRGEPVDLVMVAAGGPLMDDIDPAVRIVDLGCKRAVRAIPALARYLRQVRPTGLLAALNYTNVVAVLAARLAGTGVPVVVAEHNSLLTTAPAEIGLKERIRVRLMRATYPQAHAVIAVSEAMGAQIRDRLGVPAAQVRVILNPIDRARIAKLSAAPPDHPWFSDGGPPVLLGVGRLTEQKDFPTLFQAIAALNATQPVRLIVLGEGEDRAALEAARARLGLVDRIDLPGYAANPYPFFRQSAAFVLSSRWEGLPIVLLEALSAGAKIVATDCPTGPAEILENGRWGRLVPVGDPGALAQGIAQSLASPAPMVPERVLAPYDLDRVTDAYLEALGRPAG